MFEIYVDGIGRVRVCRFRFWGSRLFWSRVCFNRGWVLGSEGRGRGCEGGGGGYWDGVVVVVVVFVWLGRMEGGGDVERM